MAPTGEELFDRLNRGEADAVAALHAAYGSYLRAVVRRQLAARLRTKFDSADVVQSVWVQVLQQLGRDGWKPESEPQLRALLATIARRRLANRARHHGRGLAAERPADDGWDAVPDAPRARPSEVAQADELWDRMLGALRPEHRELLVLRREGLSLEEIAARTGLHEGSVRRILRRLFSDLALRDDPPAPEAAAADLPQP
ncbi:MAG TPA: sigma-70 family RNA polymerase sigma factor [Urbifossiella sp.]|jgi:RNA polymerase sigma-70 factor (ECF subfamily)|nr:sigma-70 family RNA polymerase sigma factor [Urbifossiella sp.]